MRYLDIWGAGLGGYVGVYFFFPLNFTCSCLLVSFFLRYTLNIFLFICVFTSISFYSSIESLHGICMFESWPLGGGGVGRKEGGVGLIKKVRFKNGPKVLVY